MYKIPKGNIPWNKGLTKDTDHRLMALSIKTKGPEKPKKEPFSSKGMTYEERYSIDTAKRMKESASIKMKETIKNHADNPNFGMKGKTHSKETKKKIGNKSKGRPKSPETIELLRRKAKESWARRKSNHSD